jgi:hypothetical protein
MADLPHYDDIQIQVLVTARSSNGELCTLVDKKFAAGDHRKFSASHGVDYVLFAYENADVPPMNIVRAVQSATEDILTSGLKHRGKA